MTQFATSSVATVPAVGAEVIDPRSLAVQAVEVAARQRSPETRRTYTAVYRSFTAFLGRGPRSRT